MDSLIRIDADPAPCPAPRPAYVIQIGGNLADWVAIVDWIKLAATIGRKHPTVIVPTGGPFAETVDEAEDMWRLAPDIVQRMMLLAMDGHGLMLHGICPDLAPASDIAAIAANAASGRTSVWLPSAMAAARPDLTERWDGDADTLAAWLAVELHAERLILVKHGACPCHNADAGAMMRDGLVGPGFPAWRTRFRGKVLCVNRDHVDAFGVAFQSGLEFGCPLASDQPRGVSAGTARRSTTSGS